MVEHFIPGFGYKNSTSGTACDFLWLLILVHVCSITLKQKQITDTLQKLWNQKKSVTFDKKWAFFSIAWLQMKVYYHSWESVCSIKKVFVPQTLRTLSFQKPSSFSATNFIPETACEDVSSSLEALLSAHSVYNNSKVHFISHHILNKILFLPFSNLTIN